MDISEQGAVWQALHLDDPAWLSTFPHRVAPLPDEWLPGLLLRCDETNHWESGTTFRYLLRSTSHPGFGPKSSLLIIPLSILQCLAQRLMISQEHLLSTTYQMELARLYPGHYALEDGRRLTGAHKATSGMTFLATRTGKHAITNTFAFHICPACVAQARLLKRTLMLPYLQYCPLHHLSLRTRCDCGYSLGLFSPGTLPFTCQVCRRDWAHLPQTPLPLDRMTVEHDFSALYEFFLQKGTSEHLEYAVRLARRLVRERQLSEGKPINGKTRKVALSSMGGTSLAYVVELLVNVGLSPHDIMNRDSSRSHEW